MGYLYVMNAGGKDIYKIGISKNHPNIRAKQLQTGNDKPIRVVCYYKRRDYKQLERRLHCAFRAKRISGEWYNVKLETIVKEIEKGNKMYRFIEVMAYLWTIMLACVVIAIGYILFIGMFY